MTRPRLTKNLIAEILEKNEGLKISTNVNLKNHKATNNYFVEGGKLFKDVISNSSWADNRQKETYECDIDQTRRFIRDHIPY